MNYEKLIIDQFIGTNSRYKFFSQQLNILQNGQIAVIENKEAESIIKLIKSHIISQHGITKKLLSDISLEFNNKAMRQLCEEYKIEQIFNSPRQG